METQEVILVTQQDEEIGAMEKMQAHQKGLLHRAFSVFIFDKSGRMLLQQRAAGKYHGGLLWTNACCSHPRPNEATEDAATRRLNEELGFCTALKEVFAFTYKTPVENNLIEHEYDHVFTGEYEGAVHPNKDEVAAVAYFSLKEIQAWLNKSPASFTTWFKLAFPKIEEWWQQQNKSPL